MPLRPGEQMQFCILANVVKSGTRVKKDRLEARGRGLTYSDVGTHTSRGIRNATCHSGTVVTILEGTNKTPLATETTEQQRNNNTHFYLGRWSNV